MASGRSSRTPVEACRPPLRIRIEMRVICQVASIAESLLDSNRVSGSADALRFCEAATKLLISLAAHNKGLTGGCEILSSRLN